MLPGWFGKLSKYKTPVNALVFVMAVSCIIPFLGRTAVSWIVDVTTIGATIVYAYTSLCAYLTGRQEKNRRIEATGLAGFIIALIFTGYFMLPNLLAQSRLAVESYIILIVWCVLGILFFRVLMQQDPSHRIGKSEIAWLVLLFLILLISTVWVHDSAVTESNRMVAEIGSYCLDHAAQSEEVEAYVARRAGAFSNLVVGRLFVQMALIAVSVLIVHSIFSVIKKREKQAEVERTRAEESSKAKSIFLSNMSHDIRTPMNAVTGYTALALQQEGVPESVRTYLEKIDFSSRHLLSLINDILDMSRIESGKMELDPAPVDITKAMDEVYDIFLNQMQEKKLSYTVDATQVRDKYVVCDKNRLNRVLLNLISNALKFTPSGGAVAVTLSQTERTDEGVGFELRVKDNGIGMSREFAEHIFEAFERERSKTVNSIQGTGLGMSITKNLVDLMGGDIRLETEQGKGTEFIIHLSFPAASDQEIEELAREEHLEEKGVDFSHMRLLLVEDSPINQEIATMILEQAGFAVEHAENGKVAVDMVSAAQPEYYNAVLMDVQMPVMNGYDATRAIRALDSPNAHLPIIAMSANAFAEDV